MSKVLAATREPLRDARLALVVDDNRDSRAILRDLLTHAGYQLIEAHDGAAGVAMAEAHHPDIILMDIHLPVMDGCEATRRLKTDPALRDIPVIAISADAQWSN